jgi:hypothetical protein
MASATFSSVDRPVVIQTLWRTGGTYLSFMLRERNPVALFYEPLHEDYSKHTRADWDRFDREKSGLSRGHPLKPFHYLTDYPFQPDAGVVGHRAEFAWRPFVLRAEASEPDLQAYLAGLLDHARVGGKKPLFKFCRGFLRQPWLAKILSPSSVYLVRRPSGMLGSFRRLGGGYCLSGFLRILYLNRDESALGPIYDRVVAENAQFADLSPEALASDRLQELIPSELMQDIFLFFWAFALSAHSTPDVLIFDAGVLGAERDVQEASARALADHTGLDVGFSDAQKLDEGDGCTLDFTDRRYFVDCLRSATRLICRDTDLSQLHGELALQHAILRGEA